MSLEAVRTLNTTIRLLNLCDIEVYGAVEVNFHTLLSLVISYINDVCEVGINITYDFGGV
jgi:hypothetical protein